MVPSPEIDAETDLKDAGLMILSSGLVYQWRSVSKCERQKQMERALVSVSATSYPQT